VAAEHGLSRSAAEQYIEGGFVSVDGHWSKSLAPAWRRSSKSCWPRMPASMR
jgi:16S rRNA U516 pseudouridylate synthase RsuA-like enzyme